MRKSKKDEPLANLKHFMIQQEPFTGCKLKVRRSDHGGEFLSKDFDHFCSENGILHQFTTSFTPEQNGVAERMNQRILEMAKSMMYQMNVPLDDWGEAVATAVHLINRTPTSALNGFTPEGVWIGHPLTRLRLYESSLWFYCLQTQNIPR